MAGTETRRYEMLVRVRDFGDAHGDLFPTSSLAREQFSAVGEAVKVLSEYSVRKMSAKQEGKRTKAMARDALVARLDATARTARAIARDTSGFEDRFHLPSPRSDQALLTAGRLFARDAEVFRDQFLAHAMPETFVADLLETVDTFERAIHDREAGKGGQTAARARMDAALASGTAAVQKLDAMVTNHLRNDAATTALWWGIRRIGHPRRVRNVKAVSAVAPLQTTPSSVMEKAS